MSVERDDQVSAVLAQQQQARRERLFTAPAPITTIQPSQEERQAGAITQFGLQSVNKVLETEIAKAGSRVTPETQALRTTSANVARAETQKQQLLSDIDTAKAQVSELEQLLRNVRQDPSKFQLNGKSIVGQDITVLQDQVNDLKQFIDQGQGAVNQISDFQRSAVSNVFAQIQPIQEARRSASNAVKRIQAMGREFVAFGEGVGTQFESIGETALVGSGLERLPSEVVQRRMGVPAAGSIASVLGFGPSRIQEGESFFRSRIDPIRREGQRLGIEAREPLERGQPANLLQIVAGTGLSFTAGAADVLTSPLRPLLFGESISAGIGLATSPRERQRFVSGIARDPTGFLGGVAGGFAGGQILSGALSSVLPSRASVRQARIQRRAEIATPERMLLFEEELGLRFPQERVETRSITELGRFEPTGDTLIEGVVAGDGGGMGEFFVGRGSQQTPFSRTFGRTGAGLVETMQVPPGVTPRPLLRPLIFRDIASRSVFTPGIRPAIGSTVPGVLGTGSGLGAGLFFGALTSLRQPRDIISQQRTIQRPTVSPRLTIPGVLPVSAQGFNVRQPQITRIGIGLISSQPQTLRQRQRTRQRLSTPSLITQERTIQEQDRIIPTGSLFGGFGEPLPVRRRIDRRRGRRPRITTVPGVFGKVERRAPVLKPGEFLRGII